MRQYNEEIDKTIIEILYQKGERTSGKLKEDVEESIKHTLSFETYSYRLIAMLKPYRKESRYIICPILNKRDEGRGKNIFYSLTPDAKMRYNLKLPIMKVEESIEKAYRLLFYYIIFFHTQTIKLKDEDEYYTFLDKLSIKKNELEYQGKAIINDKDVKDKIFESTNWIHGQSEIRFIQKHHLEGSGNEGNTNIFTFYQEFLLQSLEELENPGLVYQELDFTKHEVIQYFELLEKRNLIKKLQLYPLMVLNEERYIIVDDSLKDILLECWRLYSYGIMYLIYKWQSICRPINEEKVWYEHLWGKSRSQEWFVHCYHKRREYKKKNKNQVLKETQEKLDREKSEIMKKFDSINNEYAKLINDYSYFIKPLLNVVYPEFLRKEFKQ